MCVVAVLGSLMVSYTRARAEALGVECKVGIATRPVRVVILSIGLVFAKGAGVVDIELLAPAIYAMAVLTAFTVVQRVWHVATSSTARTARTPPERPVHRRRVTARTGSVVLISSLSVIQEDFETNEHTQRQANGAATAHGARDDKVRVAIVGVGNCASSFVQGVQYYKDADPDEQVPGLMHVDLGGYHVRDIEFTAAFDIDAEKVGKDLSEAIWSRARTTR